MPHARRSPRLVLALAALGGCTNDDGDAETGASTATADTGAEATDDLGTTGASNATTGADGASAPTSDDGADMGIPCEPDPVPELCLDYGDRWIECIYDGAIPADGIQDGCSCFLQLGLDMYGAQCMAALEDYYACIALAECMSIAIGEACLAEADVIAGICPSLSPV